MKYIVILSLVIVSIVVLLTSLTSAGSNVGFSYNPSKKFHLQVPDIKLSDEQKESLYQGKPICRLLPGRSGFKSGRMEVVLPFDPVTTFQIVSDIDHFHLVDPSYPSSGSTFRTRKSFMPYVFDGAHCIENGHEYLYQLLVMPLVDPRKYSLTRFHDMTEFPWESAWEASPNLECSGKGNPEMAELAKDAVHITINTGSWRIGPLSAEMRKTEEDKMRSYVIYFVDTNPGGDLGKLAPIVNEATKTAMPKLVANIKFHGPSWRAHLKKYHNAQEVAQYDAWLEAYKQSMGVQQ